MENRRKWIWSLAAFFVMVIVCCGIFLPGRILKWQSSKDHNLVQTTSKEQYSAASVAIARAASMNLKTLEKLQLITGQWESTISRNQSLDMEMEDYEAVELAKEGIQKLVEKQFYPKAILSDYGEWYTWSGTPYKAVDTTFEIYTAYYWRIEFHKYDNEINHIVYMLEDGTIFFAMIQEAKDAKTYQGISMFDAMKNQPSYEVTAVSMEHMQLEKFLPYEEVLDKEFNWKSLTSVEKEQESFQVLQALGDGIGIWSVVPQ